MTPDPKVTNVPKQDTNAVEVLPDATPRREGGDDAIAEATPIDSQSDEKVITNGTDAIVNTAFQTDPFGGGSTESGLPD